MGVRDRQGTYIIDMELKARHGTKCARQQSGRGRIRGMYGPRFVPQKKTQLHPGDGEGDGNRERHPTTLPVDRDGGFHAVVCILHQAALHPCSKSFQPSETQTGTETHRSPSTESHRDLNTAPIGVQDQAPCSFCGSPWGTHTPLNERP